MTARMYKTAFRLEELRTNPPARICTSAISVVHSVRSLTFAAQQSARQAVWETTSDRCIVLVLNCCTMNRGDCNSMSVTKQHKWRLSSITLR